MVSQRRAGFHGDKRGLSVTATVLASLVATALFFVSFEGLSYVGHLIGLGGASWLVPVALDAAIIVATLLAIIRRAQRRGSSLEWAIVYASTAASASANFSSHWERDDNLLPALVASSAPALLLLLSHAIIRTLIESEPPAPKVKRVAPQPVPTTTDIAAPAPAAVTDRRAQTRAPRSASEGKVAATDYPFDEILALSEEELLAQFDRLVADPRSSERGTPESPALSATTWRLIKLGYGLTVLARRTDDPDEKRTVARLKDRVKRVKERAPESVST